MPAMHRDVLDPFRKRLKISGNLGPSSSSDSSYKSEELPTKCSSFADAGLKLMKRTDEHLWALQISYDRKAAYKKWTSLILDEPGAWSISRPKAGQDYITFLSQGIGETVKDCLGVKATGTLHNRVNPLIRYAQHARDTGIKPFPIQEHVAYEFLKQTDPSPSFPRSFITSWGCSVLTVCWIHAASTVFQQSTTQRRGNWSNDHLSLWTKSNTLSNA